MSSSPLRRWLSVSVTGMVLAAVLYFPGRQKPADPVGQAEAAPLPDKFQGFWPLFGGTPQRNLVNLVEKNIPISWSVKEGARKNVKWSVPLGSKALGGLVIAGGKIFVGTNNNGPRNPAIVGDKGILMCFAAADGKFLWQAVHDKLATGRVNDWPQEGIVSTPVAEGDRLYYVSNRCEVVCADVEGNQANGTARILWKLDMIKDLGVFPHNLATCSPLVVGDTLFVITSNGVDEGHINIPAPEAPSFLAIDKKTGKVQWKDNSPSVNLVEAKKGGKNVNIRKLVDSGLVLMHGQWANPVYAEPNGKPMIIFPGGDGWIRAFDPANGQLLWKFDCNPKEAIYKLGGQGTRNDFVSTPVVWQNKLYIGVGQDPEHGPGMGHLWCIDIARTPANKDRDLSPVDDNFDPKAKVNKDSGLVWHYGGEAPEGSERNYAFGRTLSTCAVHDGLLYTADYDGYVHCLDANTGQPYWDHDMNSDTWSSPYWVDGKVYIGNEQGKMLVFEHGKTKKLLNTVNVSGKVRAPPVAANGVLYLITENPCKLYAISNEEAVRR